MEGQDVKHAVAVIDNGKFGKREIRFETGRLAKQAAGCATVYLDDETMLLSATTVSKTPRDQFDFFPLTVDVEERMYSIGKIPGSFFRREGRPTEEAILTCRLIDRPLRPSFVKGLRNEVQIVVSVMALHPDHMYDVIAINASSMSTQLAGLPFAGPVGGVRVALIDGQWVAFPNHSQVENAVFDMVVAGRIADNDVAVMMVEAEATAKTIELVKGGASAPTEAVVAEGLEAAKPFIRILCEAQMQLAKVAAKPTSEFPVFLDYQDDVYAAVEKEAKEDLAKALTIAGKQERESRLEEINNACIGKLTSEFEGREKEIPAALRSVTKKLVRQRVLRDKIRIDGRGLRDIRPLSAEVEVIPRVHGSAIFERGETQIVGVTTLNMLKMEMQLDTLSPETSKRYMHNYNFPPYSTGETGRVGTPKRREIGHGALAERALVPVLPTREEFPYAIRQVSEALGSNGSTSMGSVCASTLSLLNAGVNSQDGWGSILGSAYSGRQLNICTRTTGSGTKATAYMMFTGSTYCSKKHGATLLTAGNSDASAIGDANGTLWVQENSSSGTVKSCLNAVETAGALGVGIMGLDNPPGGTDNWKFVALDGNTANIANAKVGKYNWAYEAYANTNKATFTSANLGNAYKLGSALIAELQNQTIINTVGGGIANGVASVTDSGTHALRPTACSQLVYQQ